MTFDPTPGEDAREDRARELVKVSDDPGGAVRLCQPLGVSCGKRAEFWPVIHAPSTNPKDGPFALVVNRPLCKRHVREPRVWFTRELISKTLRIFSVEKPFTAPPNLFQPSWGKIRIDSPSSPFPR